MVTRTQCLTRKRQQRLGTAAQTHRVNLPQDCSLSKEDGLPGVHQNQVKVGLPGPVWHSGLQFTHIYVT